MYSFKLPRSPILGTVLLASCLFPHVFTLPTLPVHMPNILNLTAREFGHRCITLPSGLESDISFDDCMEANDLFLNEHGLGIYTWTRDVEKEHWPGYILLPDDRSVRSCTVTWNIVSGTQFELSSHDLWFSSENLIRLCVESNNNDGGSSIFGPSRNELIGAMVTRYNPRATAHNSSETSSVEMNDLLDARILSLD